MNIKFVSSQSPDNYRGGDSIYDKKIFQALVDQEASMSRIYLQPVTRSKQISNAIIKGVPPAYAGYCSERNIEVLSKLDNEKTCLIVSHERLALPLFNSAYRGRVFFIIHNLMSAAEGRFKGFMDYQERILRLEDQIFSRPNTIVGVLSEREYQKARAIWPRSEIRLVPPGIGSPFLSSPSELDVSQLHLSGSTEWWLKRRDQKWFQRRYNGPVPLREEELRDDGRLRIAVVPDRFLAGFKLKTSDLLSRNTIILSLVDLRRDFSEELRPYNTVRNINHPRDVNKEIEYVNENIIGICEEVKVLKSLWSQSLTWRRSALEVLDAVANR